MEKLNEDEYTDRTDATFDIALHEYGLVRNPTNNDTVFCLNTVDNHEVAEDFEYIYVHSIIEKEDVYNALQEAGDGYFSFIGSDLETEIDRLDNDYLSHHIFSLNMYNGVFDPRY